MEKTAVIDYRAPAEAERKLMLHGFRVIRTVPSAKLPTPLRAHPDMLFALIENTVISSADYVEEAPAFFDDLSHAARLDFIITEDKFLPEYPHDCIFNALVMGDRIFCKSDSVSPAILRAAYKYGKKVISTKQGYPACMVLPLGARDAVTADAGMARILMREGINVTLINNGGISLPPYEYGFIGGCAGISDGTVYFLGNPERHPDSDKIIGALERAGLRFVALADTELFDLGRIVFI